MLYTFSSELYEEMELALGGIDDMPQPSNDKLLDYVNCCRHYIGRMEKFILNTGFKDEHQEIYFHKYIYPRFNSWIIYHIELSSIIRSIPIGTNVNVRDYYIQELNYCHRYFNQNRYAYEYYLADDDVKDAMFFLNRNYVPLYQTINMLGTNPALYTNEGPTFSKFIAYERLQQYLIRRLRLLYQNPDDVYLVGLLSGKKRQWDGDKIELVEIAYGIYYTKRMNGGKADVSDVIEWLEDSLQVDLSQAYRIFLDIRRRKKISYTKYLDEMRDAIIAHIRESNRFKPNRKKSLKNDLS